MKTPNIGISNQNLPLITNLLNQLLADEFVLYTKTRNFHWNVTGSHFHELHKMFEAQYEELDDIIDEVAERARSLGGIAAGSLAEFIKLTRLKEQSGSLLKDHAMINALLEDHESVIKTLRADLETCQNQWSDAGTADFLTGLMEQHEKIAWMLRASLND